jgi:hypothetical protein
MGQNVTPPPPYRTIDVPGLTEEDMSVLPLLFPPTLDRFDMIEAVVFCVFCGILPNCNLLLSIEMTN